jgi:hypothetical protein
MGAREARVDVGAGVEAAGARTWDARRLPSVMSLHFAAVFAWRSCPRPGAPRCWTVEYRPARGAPPRAELAVCDVREDYQRFLAADPQSQATLAPTVARSRSAIEQSALERIEVILAETAIPLSIESSPLGMDGVSYRLELRGG